MNRLKGQYKYGKENICNLLLGSCHHLVVDLIIFYLFFFLCRSFFTQTYFSISMIKGTRCQQTVYWCRHDSLYQHWHQLRSNCSIIQTTKFMCVVFSEFGDRYHTRRFYSMVLASAFVSCTRTTSRELWWSYRRLWTTTLQTKMLSMASSDDSIPISSDIDKTVSLCVFDVFPLVSETR